MDSFILECSECNKYINDYINMKNLNELTAPLQKNIDDIVYTSYRNDNIITSNRFSLLQLLFCLF